MESSNIFKDRRYRIVPVIAENTADSPASPKHGTTLRGFRFSLRKPAIQPFIYCNIQKHASQIYCQRNSRKKLLAVH
jgi:hypothetical protein